MEVDIKSIVSEKCLGGKIKRTIFELFSSKDQSLLVWWDAFLVLDLGLDIVDGVG